MDQQVNEDVVLSAIRRGEDSLPKLRAATGLEYAQLHPLLYSLEYDDGEIVRKETPTGFARYVTKENCQTERIRMDPIGTQQAIPPAAFRQSGSPIEDREMKEQVDDALLRGVERTFGKLTIDLAATDEDHKAPKWITPERDTFTVNWAEEIGDGLGWLNPPPEVDLNPWIQKCANEGKRGARLLVITPAIVDEFWFWEYLMEQATIYVLYPRKYYQDIPCPLILSAFNAGPHQPDGRLHLWNWTTGVIR